MSEWQRLMFITLCAGLIFIAIGVTATCLKDPLGMITSVLCATICIVVWVVGREEASK